MSIRVEQQPATPWQPPAAESAAPTDAATAILECMVRSRNAQSSSARADAEHARALVERAREQIKQAMERADAAEEAGGLWGDLSNLLGSDIASIAGVIAAAAFTIGTCGAGAPAMLAVSAAMLTIGAKVGQELGADPRVMLALGACGSALGLLGGNLASAKNTFTTVAQVAHGVQLAATAGGGGAKIGEGVWQGAAEDHRAEATAARGRQTDAWLRLELAIDMLDRACREVSSAQERTSNIVKDESDGQSAVISRMGAA
jgi:hypothetical protein